MSLYPIVTEGDMNISAKLFEQEQNQRAIQVKFSISKQTHDKKPAKSLEPINKKNCQVIDSTKKN